MRTAAIRGFVDADAIVFANVKGPKDKDYLAVAHALDWVKSQPGYQSNKKVAERYPIGHEMVREFLTILKLPDEVQVLFERGLLKLEHGKKLYQLRDKPQLLQEVAQAITGLKAHQARDVVVHILNYPHLSVREAKEQVLASARPEPEFHVIALLNEREYKRIRRRATQKHIDVSELVSSIVRDWLNVERPSE